MTPIAMHSGYTQGGDRESFARVADWIAKQWKAAAMPARAATHAGSARRPSDQKTGNSLLAYECDQWLRWTSGI